MNNQSGILQQRIQIVAIEGRVREQSLKRVRCQQRESQKTHCHHAHHTQHPRDHHQREAAAKRRHRSHPAGQNEHPQQERALVVSPQGRKFEDRWQQTIGVGGYHGHREIVLQKAHGQQRKGHSNENRHTYGQGGRHVHSGNIAPHRAPHRHHSQPNCQHKGNDQRDVAKLGDHGRTG